MGVAARFGLVSVLLCAACGSGTKTPASPTAPTPTASSLAPFDATPFAGQPIPQFGGRWRAPSRMVGCAEGMGFASSCTAMQRIFSVQPPLVELTVTQQTGIQLLGTAMIHSSAYSLPVEGVVTRDGGFVVDGSASVFGERRSVSGHFTPNADSPRANVFMRRETLDGRLIAAYQLQGVVTLQQ